MSTVLADAAAFLFTGSNPVQTGVASGALQPDSIAVIRGVIRDRNGSPVLSGVTVTVVDHPELGSTLSRTDDGSFDIAVNGGQTLRLRFALPGFLTVERTVSTPKQDYVVLRDVVLTPPDALDTVVDLSGASSQMQVARSTPSAGEWGSRQPTLLVPPGTSAVMAMPNGSSQGLPSMHFRATEYSVGVLGPDALPATPPSGTAYPYTVELSADEAVTAGASRVEFSQPLPFYVENYLGLPVGVSVPHGVYKAATGLWESSSKGRVIKVLAANSGLADLDVDGDGAVETASALAMLGITEPEREALATLYQEGQSVWRIPLAQFSTHAAGHPVAPNGNTECPVPPCHDAEGAEIPCKVRLDKVRCYQPWEGVTGPDCDNMNYCEEKGAGSTWGGCVGNGAAARCYYYCCQPPYWPDIQTDACAGEQPTPTCSYPPLPSTPDGDGPGECQQPHASTIHCQRQALGEDVPIAGTPYVLQYQSDRQRGRSTELNVPVTSALPYPAGLLRIEVTVSVAGRSFPYVFTPEPNQSFTFQWDGLDAYGRVVQGNQPVTVEIVRLFAGIYKQADSFGLGTGGTNINGVATATPFGRVSLWKGTLANWDERPTGLGGWSLDVQHVYDVTGRALRRGDGSKLTLLSVPPVIETVAGTGSAGPASGDGGPATSAALPSPSAVAARGDGSLLISDGLSCVREINAQGMISTFVGQCGTPGFAGDGGPAQSALLQAPSDLALGPEGSLYIADTLNHRVRRVTPSGVITTVAGSGPTGAQAGQFSGDDGPAVDARFSSPSGIDVSSSGVLYIADTGNGRIRIVSTDAVVRTVAGNGAPTWSRSDELATMTSLAGPRRVRVGADGTFYVSEPSRDIVRKVGPDGVIRPFAGSPRGNYYGDGDRAVWAGLNAPADIAVQLDGSVAILDQNNTIRLVSPLGTIATIAGVAGAQAHGGDRGFAAAATFGPAHGLGLGRDGSIYLAATSDNRVRRIAPGLPGFSGSQDVIRIPSSDGQVVHTFDAGGRHLSDTHASTGAVLTSFGYDCEGRLASVADAEGNLTTIQRDANGNPTAIVAPFGQTSLLTLDANGYLATVSDPNEATTTFTYDSSGLMTSKLDAKGGLAHYSYDGAGRLARDDDAAGGAKILTRSQSGDDFTVNMSTALGLQSTFETWLTPDGSLVRSNTGGNGAFSSFLRFSPNGVTTSLLADGTMTVSTPAPDPRFGVLAPALSVSTTLPRSGLTRVASNVRSVAYSGANIAAITEAVTVNGKTWLREFDATARIWTTTSPLGRRATIAVDSAGKPTSVAMSGVTPRTFSFDSYGRLSSTGQGPRQTTFSYFSGGPANGYLQSQTDAGTQTTSYERDALGRLLGASTAGISTGFGWDQLGNMTSVTPPARPAHALAYTPVNLLDAYTAPVLTSSADSTTVYEYDVDRKLTTETRPDGLVLSYTYDNAGRLLTITAPNAAQSRAYSGSQLSRIDNPVDGVYLNLEYDGALPLQSTWSGSLAGSRVRWSRDSDFRVSREDITDAYSAVTSVEHSYDNDGLLICASIASCAPPGPEALLLNRDPANGLLSGSTLGLVDHSLTYNGFGELATEVADAQGTPLFLEQYDTAAFPRDALGRIVRKTETLEGTTTTFDYSYDAHHRLETVTRDGAPLATYAYDANGNRLSVTTSTATTLATYDAQDRLLTHGEYAYTYSLNGELESRTHVPSGAATTYDYDAFGNLKRVDLPNGDVIEYLVDGKHRRVAKKHNGTLTKQWLYADALHPIAELDSSGTLVHRFVFASGKSSPDYFVRPQDGATFRILSDHLGSPRLIVDVATGQVAQRLRHDAFGNVTEDTSPGLTPFGFAGGIYDPDTGLVRFGARDYDPSVGRWVSKDPIAFEGDGPNLYAYATGDPVNHRDPMGLKTYRCFKPLDAIGGTADPGNKRNGPDWTGNPLYHEYICVKQGGKMTCGGQSSVGNKPYGPGKPSKDHYSSQRCEEYEPDNECFESCLVAEIRSPIRPRYGVVGFGTNCQEWTEDKLTKCSEACQGF